jgi:hypothetical protein
MTDGEAKQRKGLGCWGWGSILAIGAVALLYTNWPTDEQMAEIAEKEASEQDAALRSKQDSAVKTSAREMFTAFQENEIAALGRFEGQPVRISGVVDGVDADFSDDPIVKLVTSNQFMPVQVSLGKSQSDYAAQLTKGTQVEFICEKVTELAGTPMLDDCAPI